ncbi:hypothetical protein [Motilimonas eburnea]|uniref:hypothetical protein n=1 Tax=Motilimonas eburnea TaxID=1737488 RepID=UPI001E283996|nr:hypothetical protein [Motilimonas eburnea]MCE2571678.1 hypothetical protein [Motilimonas eburnea]
MRDTIQLNNYYSLEGTLTKLRDTLSATDRLDALALLEKAVNKEKQDNQYAEQMKNALQFGSTVALRELLSPFGNYWKASSDTYPYYPHSDAVNGIDSAMGAIKYDLVKRGALQEHIEFVNLMRS